MKIQGVIFDVGGTLVDTQAALLAAMRDTIADFGLPQPDDALLRANLGWSEPLLLRGLVPRELEERATLDLVCRMREELEQAPAIAGVQEALERLRGRGMRLAAASGFARPTLRSILARLAWEPYFEAVVSGDDVARPRPSPDLLIEAAGRLGLPVPACLAVGDSVFDLQSAQACGMPFAGVLSGAQAAELAALLPPGEALPSVAALPDSPLLTN